MKDYVAPKESMITRVNDIMLKLKDPIPAAKLRDFTPLKSKSRNVTRWTSTYSMLLRYYRIRDYLPRLNIDNFRCLLLNTGEDRDIEVLLHEMKQLNSLTLIL